MNILIVTQWFVSRDPEGNIYVPGGTERTSYELAKQLHMKGHKVMILAPTKDKSDVGFKIFDDIYLYRFKEPTKFYGYIIDFKSFVNTLKCINKFNPDIVHVISSRYRFALGAIAASKIIKKKIVYTTTSYPKKNRKRFIRLFDDVVISKLVSVADLITYSTPNLRELISHLRNDIIFIPNFVDTSRFKPSNLATESGYLPRILIASNFSYSKGGDIAFESIKILRKNYPDIEIAAFAYINDVNTKEKNQDNIHLSVSLEEFKKENITLLPCVSDGDMPNTLNYYDIILGQFRSGALGRFELESMACSKPIICFFKYWDWYDTPPNIISTNSPEEIAKNIEELIVNKNLIKEIGRKNRRWVKKYHDINCSLQKYMQSYEQVLNENIHSDAKFPATFRYIQDYYGSSTRRN
jgi:glycosyltransferase involved in cell wall biosynthesis